MNVVATQSLLIRYDHDVATHCVKSPIDLRANVLKGFTSVVSLRDGTAVQMSDVSSSRQ
jgi:hypothetical protein